MSSDRALLIRGTSGHLAVPITALPVIAIGSFTYFRDVLPGFCIQNAGKIFLATALLTSTLIAMAWFRKTRRIEYRSGQLRYRSWITDKTVAAAQLTAATFETELSGSDDQTTTEHYLSLWRGNEAVLRFNSRLWPRDDMTALLRALRETNPALRLDRDVAEYAGVRH